jgi:hypothetical protein
MTGMTGPYVLQLILPLLAGNLALGPRLTDLRPAPLFAFLGSPCPESPGRSLASGPSPS